MAEQPWEFDWDESNLRHLSRHRINRLEFEQAMVNDPIFMDVRGDEGEG
jgi:hypothetical protein